jgi:hypothetical protein
MDEATLAAEEAIAKNSGSFTANEFLERMTEALAEPSSVA